MPRPEQPDRPKKPSRMVPLTGDDNSAFFRWRDQCDACRHSDERLGCTEAGIVVYASGAQRGLPRPIGGCSRRSPPRRWNLRQHSSDTLQPRSDIGGHAIAARCPFGPCIAAAPREKRDGLGSPSAGAAENAEAVGGHVNRHP